MKNVLKSLLVLLSGFTLLAQTTDSIQLEIQKKQLEIMKQELEMKKKELEMKSEEFKNEKEDRTERKAEEKEKKQNQKTNFEKRVALMERNTLITLSPLPLFVGGFEMGIEKRVATKQSASLFAGYYYNDEVWFYNQGREMEGGKVNLQYRFYLNDDKPGLFGLYVGPEFMFKTISYKGAVEKLDTIYNPPYYYVDYSYQDTTIKASAASFGVVCGVKSLLFNRMTIDFQFGANLLIPLSGYESNQVSLPLVNPYGRGAHPKFALTIGVPFK